jgi:hypothetical protein
MFDFKALFKFNIRQIVSNKSLKKVILWNSFVIVNNIREIRTNKCLNFLVFRKNKQ